MGTHSLKFIFLTGLINVYARPFCLQAIQEGFLLTEYLAIVYLPNETAITFLHWDFDCGNVSEAEKRNFARYIAFHPDV